MNFIIDFSCFHYKIKIVGNMKKVMFKNIVLMSFMICVLCISFFGVTWAWSSGAVEKFYSSDDDLAISVNYIDGSMINQKCDESRQSKSFIVLNDSGKVSDFNVILYIDNVSTEDIGKYIYYQLLDDNGNILTYGNLSDIYSSSRISLIVNEEIPIGESKSYTLKVWSDVCESEGFISAHLIVN